MVVTLLESFSLLKIPYSHKQELFLVARTVDKQNDFESRVEKKGELFQLIEFFPYHP